MSADIDEMYSRDLTCQWLGITLDSAGEGGAVMRMKVATTMVNQHGIVHGGFLFLLADAAFAYACNSHGPVTVAQSAQITFVRPASTGEELVATATERARYGRHGIYDITVARADGQVVAEFRGNSVMLSGRPTSEQRT